MDSPSASGGDEAAIIAILLNPGAAPADKRLAFQRLHACYSSDLLAFLRSRVGTGSMMDVSQTVWLSVWQKIAAKFDGRNFRAWLYQIARHEAINHHRKYKKASTVQLPESLRDYRVPLSNEDEELRRVLEECLGMLDPRSRDVIRARLGGALTNEEIAELFNLSRARLFSLVSETKSTLTKCVKEKLS